jgi:ribonuclease D
MTDWARRPLSGEQLQYAAADVTHLVPAWETLRARLEERGRLGWLHEEAEALAETGLYRTDPLEAWRSVRGAGRLRPKDLAVLRELASWREGVARERDRPRRWVLPDDVLADLARRQPKTAAELSQVPGLEERAVRRHGRAVLAAIRAGLERPSQDWPRPARRRRLTPEQATLADLMALLVRLRAREHAISAPLLASRAQLERVAAGDESEDLSVLRGWRLAVVGEDLIALRDGRLRLAVEDGEVRAEPG